MGVVDPLFSRLGLADVRGDVLRNIVSLRASQNLFDDLTDEPAHWLLAQQVEDAVKPPPYRSHTPVIDRPFEDAAWFDAIRWPFTNWRVSRFSDGSFGAWYGCDSVEATVYETAYHWVHGLLTDAGYESEQVIGERKVYAVACNAALLDFRKIVPDFPELAHKTDYSYAQLVGARIHREGHPGLLIPSVRYRRELCGVQPGGAVQPENELSAHLSARRRANRRREGGRHSVAGHRGRETLSLR